MEEEKDTSLSDKERDQRLHGGKSHEELLHETESLPTSGWYELVEENFYKDNYQLITLYT
jgi:hypothetical protein